MALSAVSRAARLGLLLLLWAGSLGAQVERVSYGVEYRAEVRDRAFVTATFSGKAESRPLDVQIPSWSPGAYEIKPFHKRILNFAAKDAKGATLEVTKPDELTWRIAASRDWPIFASYERLDQPEGLADTGKPSPRKRDYVGFNPTDTFMYAVDAKTVPHDVKFTVPQGWLIAMARPSDEGGTRFSAPDYDTLADCPIELGHLTIHKFKVGDVTHSIVLDFRDRRFQLQSLEALLRKIIRYQVGMFGAKDAASSGGARPPYASYEFHFHDGPGFGLEHLSSTTLAVPTSLLRGMGPGLFDSLYAHEYFHLWNVKRIRPKQLGPFDYTKPVRTKALWLCEGVTDYYADVTCWRARIWNDGKFLETMRGEIQRLQSTPRRLVETVEASSWAAFDRGYGGIGTEEHVDYYNKGKLIGLCLDLTIRDRTNGEKSLDDVMRGLYAKYALPKPGFDEDALPKEFSEIAGFDLEPFFKSYISGVAELPFAECFETIGVRLNAGQPDRKGVIGWWQRSGLEIVDGELVVKTPCDPLAEVGLAEGDRIVSVNDVALPKAGKPSELLPALVPPQAGASVLRVRRGDREISVTLPFPMRSNWDLNRVHDPTPRQRARFEQYKADPYSGLVQDGPTLETIGLPPPR
jgi:predicted metalloprotease with PDZ domain